MIDLPLRHPQLFKRNVSHGMVTFFECTVCGHLSCVATGTKGQIKIIEGNVWDRFPHFVFFWGYSETTR